MMSIAPPALHKGDTIGVFAPSSWVERDDIEKSTALLEAKGYKVFVHPQTYERENQSAGTILQKALAFQGLWQRKDIKAIWTAGGGNRCLHLIDTINFERLKKTPKILIGFSDVTALLNAVNAKTDITTFHGPVFKNLHKYEQLDHLLQILNGDTDIQYPISDAQIIKSGEASGKLIGGNLSVFQYLPQTFSDDFYKDSILFLEDCNEELSRMDRMLLHLRKINVLNSVKAIIFGQFTNIPESGKPFGYSLKDIIEEHTHDLDIPVLCDLPFGHGKNLYTFPIGCDATISTDTKSFKLNHAATSG